MDEAQTLRLLGWTVGGIVGALFVVPAKTIFVPGTLALGSLMYSLQVASFQTMPEFLLASEYW